MGFVYPKKRKQGKNISEGIKSRKASIIWRCISGSAARGIPDFSAFREQANGPPYVGMCWRLCLIRAIKGYKLGLIRIQSAIWANRNAEAQAAGFCAPENSTKSPLRNGGKWCILELWSRVRKVSAVQGGSVSPQSGEREGYSGI